MAAFLVIIGHVRSNAEFAARRAQGPSAERWISMMAKSLGEHRDRHPALTAAIVSGMTNEDISSDRRRVALEVSRPGAWYGHRQSAGKKRCGAHGVESMAGLCFQNQSQQVASLRPVLAY
jgi:hypothetical protein